MSSLVSDSASGVSNATGLPGLGTTIAGKYRIENKLGAGGMGVVVAARHIELNQMVAIKFLHPNVEGHEVIKARFLREARASAALRSEHVTRVYDVGTTEHGAPYMVMEHLEGVSLSKAIRKRAPFPITESVDLMLQACKAMDEAHSLGIVHRDIKPGNMFLARQPDGSTMLKVLDFGISKMENRLDDEAEPTLTASNMVLGSPKYFAPEQVKDAKTVDHRADVWALGIVLYYMLAGRRPFEGDTMSSVCVAIATEQPLRVSDIRPTTPPMLDAAVMGCLIKDRERRTQSAADLARAIAPFGSLATHAPDPVDPIGLGGGAIGARALAPYGSNQSSPVVIAQLPKQVPPAGLQHTMDPIAVGLADDTRNGAMEVDATKAPRSVLWMQIAAAVAVVAVGMFLLLRGDSAPSNNEMGSIVAVSTPSSDTSAAPKPADKPGERTVLIPSDAPRPKATVKGNDDLDETLQKNQLATTRVTLRLLSAPGATKAIAVVPKDEVVSILQVRGEWVLVNHVDATQVVRGWTMRNLIE
jgi:eukaryotic-like serine/threonine-protein kinase